MKRIIMLLLPVLVIVLAFHPVKGFKVTGKITDEQRNPITGVTVTVKGSNTATTTGNDGKYLVEAADKNDVLVISYVGFVSQNIKIKGRSVIDIVLKASTQSLNEVVVIGYARDGEVDKTEAISRKQITPNSSQVSEVLQGKAPGVSIRIRGIASTNGRKSGNGYYDQKKKTSTQKVTTSLQKTGS